MRQAVKKLVPQGHYDHSLRESINDEGGFHDVLCCRVLEGAPSSCLEGAPYLEGTRGTGGWVS
jgi:hypothetical protein